MSREKRRAAQGWQFYASELGGEGKGGEIPNERRKKGTTKKTQKQNNKTKQTKIRLLAKKYSRID